MLEEIRIRGLGVIEESVLELGPGFTAITGETGAGKTMLVTALDLLLGGRADSGAVRRGARSARVEGIVDVADSPEVAELVDDAGGVVEDGRLVIARQVSAEGRSRAFAGGAAVPAASLAVCAERLVAVHGQSDQHVLLRPAAQRDVLDRFAGSEALVLRADFAQAHAGLRAVEAELAQVIGSVLERAREADLLRFGLQEVERVAPAPGEDAELAAEESRLAYADTLRGAAEQARAWLSSDSTTGDAAGPLDGLGAVAAARRLLDGVRDLDPQAAALADRLAEVGYLMSDLAGDVASYASRVETDPGRLAAVSERRAALTSLTRRYGESIDDVLAWAAASSRRLLELDDTDGHLERLEAERQRCRSVLADLGAQLSAVRSRSAQELCDAAGAELAGLAMPQARLQVLVLQVDDPQGLLLEQGDGAAPRQVRFTATGLDEVEFRLAANPGAETRPLARGASGGELSRVMLALEVVLAGTSPVPTFVFDEVDAGVGGMAAVEVGRRLAALAASAQVIVVTHLPQVAAFCDCHVRVAKSADGSVTTSDVAVLDDEGRVRELSRMLAGLEGSLTGRAHALELLENARRRAA